MTPHLPQDEARPQSLSASQLAANEQADSQARAALAASPLVDLRELNVERRGETLMISGRVHCFYHKQLAQETVRPHAANLRVVNAVNVEN